MKHSHGAHMCLNVFITLSVICIAHIASAKFEVTHVEELEAMIGHVSDISADGSVVVGEIAHAPPAAFRWENGQFEFIQELSNTTGVSDDGTVVVGNLYYYNMELQDYCWAAVRWEDDTSLVLGFLPGQVESVAEYVSGDGNVIVGSSGDSIFRWQDGAFDIIAAAGAFQPCAISYSGDVVYGITGGDLPYQPLKWENGVIEQVDVFPQHTQAYINDTSSDGRIAVGSINFQSVHWVDGTPQSLDTPSEYDICAAISVSADGSVIIGTYFHSRNLVVWSAGNDWQPCNIDLGAALEDRGFPNEGGLSPLSLSEDGTTVVVYDYSNEQAWLATIENIPYLGSYKVNEQGYCNTESWMGWLSVENDPWFYCESVPCWLSIPEETITNEQGWIFFPEVDKLQLFIIDGSNWAYTSCLGKWFYMAGGGWVYMVTE